MSGLKWWEIKTKDKALKNNAGCLYFEKISVHLTKITDHCAFCLWIRVSCWTIVDKNYNNKPITPLDNCKWDPRIRWRSKGLCSWSITYTVKTVMRTTWVSRANHSRHESTNTVGLAPLVLWSPNTSTPWNLSKMWMLILYSYEGSRRHYLHLGSMTFSEQGWRTLVTYSTCNLAQHNQIKNSRAAGKDRGGGELGVAPPVTNSLGLVTWPPSEVTISEEDCSCNRKLIRQS